MNNVFLLDTVSSRKVLGADNLILAYEYPPFVKKFYSKNKTQILTCYFHPGDFRYSISEYKVEMNVADNYKFNNDSSLRGIIILEDILSFKSGKEIELGIDSSEVIKNLGEPTSKTNDNGLDVFIFEIKNPIYYSEEKSEFGSYEFLSYFNLPLYYGNYVFKNGKIIEFSFGFAYP